MSDTRLAEHIKNRSRAVGLQPADDLVGSLAAYLELLARWNKRINLTAFALDDPTDAAIDRLLVEPLMAAEIIPTGPLIAADIGSGGGSPAVPLKLARPQLRMTLFEARERKSAFLREAVRALGLQEIDVQTERIDDVRGVPGRMRGCVDFVTMRAVRADDGLVDAVVTMLRAGGEWLIFGEEPVRPHDLLEAVPHSARGLLRYRRRQ